MPAELVVATLNLFNNRHGRWADREPLVAGQARELDADVFTFQEVDLRSDQVDRLAALLGDDYQVVTRGGTAPGTSKALAVVTRLAVRATAECTDLGHGDVALAVELDAGAATVWVATTHLLFSPSPGGSARRHGQAERLLAWLGALHPLVLAGDFNATDDGEAIALLKGTLRSAFEVAHGHEPDRTHPTPLLEAVDTRAAFGDPKLPDGGAAVDFVFVTDDVDVVACDLAFDRPAPTEASLYPSDHFGLVARLRVA